MEKLCYGCMRMKQRSPLCEHCGYNENIDNMPHQLPLGTILGGRYEVGKALGQGGFGITYIGRDLNSGETLAIKEFYPRAIVSRDSSKSLYVSCSDSEASFRSNRERFLREARMLKRLDNIPSVVHVYDFFEENDTAYIVMEFVQGVNLKTYVNLRGGRLSPEHTIRLLEPIMDALEAVHRANLVHRDISPDNIMILANGSAKLLDFGAAREVEPGTSMSQLLSTEAILKHGFAPIEQYQRRGNLGPWTDVYAFCGTIYYCLTGKIPRDATERITDDPNMHWEEIPGLTAQQIGALEWGMAPNLRNRAQSIGQLRSGLVLPKMQTENRSRQPERTGSQPQEKVNFMLFSQLPSEKKPTEKPMQKETKPEKQPRKKQSDKKKLPLIGAAVLAVVLAGVFAVRIGMGYFGGAETDIQVQRETKPAQTLQESTAAATEYWETVPETTAAPAENIQETIEQASAAEMGTLRADVFEHSLDTWRYKKDAPQLIFPAFGNIQYTRKEIGTLTFLDSLENAPEGAMDVSQEGNGSVLCWFKSATEGYDMYIAGEGGVKAPQDCSTLFAFYSNLRRINFNNCFFTENVTSMHDMFLLCKRLETLDLQGWDTSHVTDMSFLFSRCESLESLDISSFDTSQVQSMESMFHGCENLEKLNISCFDTAAVEKMCSMFENCSSLSDLDISGFVTERVTDMSRMFYGCTALPELDFSNFDVSSVTEYTDFMHDSVKISGKPWKTLFEGEYKVDGQDDGSVEAVATGLDAEDYTFRRETFGNTVMILGENLSIQVIDGKRVIITIEGLELEYGYSTNKWNSYMNQLEYYWGLEMAGETTYSVATAFWATHPRSVTYTTLEQMQNSTFSIDTNGSFKKMGHVDMSHTDTSITWSFTINRYYPSGFENADQFVVKVVDSSLGKEILRTYTLEE